MGQVTREILNADDFLTWSLAQTTGRFELDNGRVVAMTPERVGHARAKSQAWLALRLAIAARALPCEALPDGMTVRVDDRTVYEPDTLVRCGPRLENDVVTVRDPILLLEVVSPSSRGIDKGAKIAGYFSLPSVRHYLIVDLERRLVIHHRRLDDGRIETRLLASGPIDLDPPGITIQTADIFDGV